MTEEEKNTAETVDETVREEQTPKSNLAKVLDYMERTGRTEEAAPLEEEPAKTTKEKIGTWCANFWYHYKWHSIITLFFVIVFAVTIPQFLAKKDTDIQLMYGGPIRMDDVQMGKIEDAFAELMGADMDVTEDGVLSAVLMYQTILTDAQIAEAEEKGNIILNRQELQDSKQLNLFLLSGEAIICLLDPAQYENIESADGFLPLAELGLTDLPYPTNDACSVRLKDTPFAQFFAEAFAPLPDDTILCIRRKTTVSFFQSEKTETERHDAHVALFRKILTFSITD